ncbi:transposase [Candidatus Neomarinimicrobiota bacterium]
MSDTENNTHKRQQRNQKRGRYTPETKVNLIMETIRFPRGVGKLCRERGISEHSYYTWRRHFLEAGKNRLMHTIRYHNIEEQILTLRNKCTHLKNDLEASRIANDALRVLLSTGITIKKNKHFSPEDKERIVQTLLSTDLPRYKICNELGLSKETVRTWIRNYKRDGYQGLVYKSCHRPGAWCASSK